jgi:hypothetical protein
VGRILTAAFGSDDRLRMFLNDSELSILVTCELPRRTVS